jgi:hypothetical protein
MTIETPCRVRDGVSFLEPLARDREPLQLRGVHALSQSKESTLSLSKGSLKRVRGTHLHGQVHEETPTRHRGGGFLRYRFSALPPPFPM